MKCQSCNHENRDNSNFCTACGLPLISVCSHCQTPAVMDDVFCANCGFRLLANNTLGVSMQKKNTQLVQNIQSQNSTEEKHHSERKVVTVLFADISGFTSMSEKLDP